MRDHCSDDLVLSGFKFFLERVPFSTLRELDDAVAAVDEVLFNAEPFRHALDVLRDVLHLLSILGLHSEVAIGYERAEVERDLLAAGKCT